MKTETGSVNSRINLNLVPPIRYVTLRQHIVAPSFASRALKTTVFQSFSLRQANENALIAIGKAAAPFNLEQQHLSLNVNAMILRHAGILQRPLGVDEFHMDSRDPIGPSTPSAYGRVNGEVVLSARKANEPSDRNLHSGI